MSHEPQPDYYEIMQLSPQADQETIERVFRHLAKRYHPDNLDSGNAERFTELMAAYRVLSDVEQRAKYDVGLQAARESRWRIFDQESSNNDLVVDSRIRRAALSSLYSARRNNSRDPGVGIVELERLLGCLEETMRFHIWYLRENGWIQRLETGTFAITAAAHFELGEYDEAFLAISRAAGLAQLEGDDLLVAQCSNNLAMLANIRGRHEEALALYRIALAAYQRVGEAIGYARSLPNIAITYRDTDRLTDADEYEQRAIDGARQAGDESLVAIVMAARADVQLRRGDSPMAEATALHAATLLAQVPDPTRQADALRVAGLARARNGDHPRALQRLDEAVEVARSCGAALIEAESLRARGESRRALGDGALAREDGEAALAIFRRLGAVRQEAATARWIDELG